MLARESIKYIPGAECRELVATAMLFFGSREQEVIRSKHVADFYKKLEASGGRELDPITLQAILFHRSYGLEAVTPAFLESVDWYFIDDPSHISYHLTNGGQDRSLLNVARRYLDGNYPKIGIKGWKEMAVLGILKSIQNQRALPNVILSSRPQGMRPDGKKHIIDGVHRLLGNSIYYLQTGEIAQMEAYLS